MTDKIEKRLSAIQRIVDFVVALDHFQEVFWPDASSDIYEFGMYGILEGFKNQHPNDDSGYVVFGMVLLDSMMHRMENRIWAEEELQKGVAFNSRYGKGLGIETINDEVMKLGQKMGYAIIVRKDPRKGYVRIKARPQKSVILNATKNLLFRHPGLDPVSIDSRLRGNDDGEVPSVTPQNDKSIDLTLVYEQLCKMDPNATWFLHVSKKMLLNGTPKNPTMVPTTLTLQQIVDVVRRI